MSIEIRQFQPRRIIRQVNKGLRKGRTLDELLKEIAPDYGISHEALYQRLRLHGGRLMKQIIVAGESENA